MFPSGFLLGEVNTPRLILNVAPLPWLKAPSLTSPRGRIGKGTVTGSWRERVGEGRGKEQKGGF